MSELTSTSVLGEVTRILETGGYTKLEDGEHEGPTQRFSHNRLFEDPFGVVLVTVWDTWHAMRAEWPAAQADLVEVMSQHISRSDAKAWDGYLVLLLPKESAGLKERELDQLRKDTSRVRKLVAAGSDLRSLSDLERILAPLLPLSLENLQGPPMHALEVLPDLIDDPETSRRSLILLANAFLQGESLVECLHQNLWGEGET